MLTSFDVGGTERQTVELVKRLDPERFAVHVACFHKRGPLLGALPDSMPIEAFPVRGFRRPASIGQWWRFAQWCRHVGARVVHTCDLYSNVFGLTAAAAARVPVRIGSRREIVTGDKTRVQLAGQRLAYRVAHAVVANAPAVVTRLEREGIPPARIHLIPNGVDLAAYDGGRIRRRGSNRITVVANLRPEKGHDVLIDAAPGILAARPDAEFLIAGSGPMAADLAARAANKGVADRFWFLGHCDNVPGLLAESDLFVLPSRSEALPNALIEAMAAGLPVVATSVGGIPDLIASGVTGLIVPPNDPVALARAIVHLLNQADHAAVLGQAARARVQRDYAFSRMVASVEQLYLAEIERHLAVLRGRVDSPVTLGARH
jgi:glycosyltransferase involved in cell wall biosynthesis